MQEIDKRYHVLTIFDYNKYPPLPLQSVIVRGTDVSFYTFYLPGTGIKIKQIKESIEEFKNVFQDIISINDFKSHITAFNLDHVIDYNVYDISIPDINIIPKSETSGKIFLLKLYKKLKNRKLCVWRNLLANCSIVYQNLEDRGIRHGYASEYPRYSLNTFTGRSKTLRFNIQGTTDKFDIGPLNNSCKYFVHFDWIGADLLMAAYMAKDEEMLNSFKKSDPYTVVSKWRNDPEFTRDRCKKDFLQAVYSLNFSGYVLDRFPVFREWMVERKKQMLDVGYVETILGRKFRLNGDNHKRVFNAQFQGSVVHAMQASLVRIVDQGYLSNLFAEVHDSIILNSSEVDLKDTIQDIVEIMNNPLREYMYNPPFMPVKVSIGKHWKRWRTYKDFR